MCCLFGIMDYRRNLDMNQKNLLLSSLATASEARGTDATGIAYNYRGKLSIYKRPLPGHSMRFHVPAGASAVMGHTRMTTQGDFRHDLRKEKYLLAADSLADTARLLLRKLERPYDPNQRFSEYARLLVAPCRALIVIQKQINRLLSAATRKRLERLSSTMTLFSEGHSGMVFYIAEDVHDNVMLCAAVSDLTVQLQSTLWNQPRPILLTSGTLAVGSSFRRFREEAGLLADSRVVESVSISPFAYQENCLLYIPKLPPRQKERIYYDKLSDEIALLLEAACGHALVLFTSYSAMSAVQERLAAKGLLWPLYTLGRNAAHTAEQFKAAPGSILLATGAAWEGFDFPGDCVSLLIIPRLPFAPPRRTQGESTGGFSRPPLFYPGRRGSGDANQAEAGLRQGHPDRDGHLRHRCSGRAVRS